MSVGLNKEENVDHAVDLIRRTVAKDKPRIVALPECFNSPYSTKHFKEYSETVPDGPTCQRLSAIAKELNVYLIAGTIPERDAITNNIHNTCTLWSSTGEFLAKYRKVIDYILVIFEVKINPNSRSICSIWMLQQANMAKGVNSKNPMFSLQATRLPFLTWTILRLASAFASTYDSKSWDESIETTVISVCETSKGPI